MRTSSTTVTLCILLLAFVLLAACEVSVSVPRTCQTSIDCPRGHFCKQQACQDIEGSNKAPIAVVANEGKELRVAIGDVFHLDGSQSYDPDGKVLYYVWSFVKKPINSAISFRSTDLAKTSFQVDAEGVFVVQLVVMDDKEERSEPVRLRIIGDRSKKSTQRRQKNRKPIANAGPDQKELKVHQMVRLDGSRSKDPDGDPLTYQWECLTRPDKSRAKLSSRTQAKPTFIPDIPGEYVLSLVVHDGIESSVRDFVHVKVPLLPDLHTLLPSMGFIGKQITVKLHGQHFASDASVFWGRSKLSDGVVKVANSSVIQITVTPRGKANERISVKVRNSNGKESQVLFFTLKEHPKTENPNASPLIKSIHPPYGEGDRKVTLTIHGSHFEPKSVFWFSNSPLTTIYKSSTELQVTVDFRHMLTGKYPVKVKNSNGKVSPEWRYPVHQIEFLATLKTLVPPRAKTGSKISFSAYGNSFLWSSVILFDGKKIPSKRISKSQIDASPSLDLTGVKPGRYRVQILDPSGRKTNAVEFEVESLLKTPRLSRIIPLFVYIGKKQILLIYGANFEKGTEFLLGQKRITAPNVVFKNDRFLEVHLNTTQGTWSPGDVIAKVRNPNGQLSKGFKLTISK